LGDGGEEERREEGQQVEKSSSGRRSTINHITKPQAASLDVLLLAGAGLAVAVLARAGVALARLAILAAGLVLAAALLADSEPVDRETGDGGDGDWRMRTSDGGDLRGGLCGGFEHRSQIT